MIGSVKGFSDILPESTRTWKRVEEEARSLFEGFGFSEIRTPIVEKTELFQRSIGGTTDIVEKEMYIFSDRKGTSITLRPEGTASVVRAYIEHNLYHEDPVAKLYYMGPMFRYERPQKGRTRQFFQIGAEVLGVDDPKLDAEVLDMLMLYFGRLGIEDVSLEINSLGCDVCRPDYRDALLGCLRSKASLLCNDCKRRLELNPLRALDCKNPRCREVASSAPSILEYLCDPCRAHFEMVKDYLSVLSCPYTVRQDMVRGLDYYTRTAFEIVCNRLGAQNAVAAGGRYDKLVKELGGPDLPGFGFAIGVERTVLLIDKAESNRNCPLVYLIPMGESGSRESLKLLKRLRLSNIRTELSYGQRSLKSHMRRADKLGAAHVVIIGDDELSKGVVTVKDMNLGSQIEVVIDKIVDYFKGSVTGTQPSGSIRRQ